MKVFLRTKDTLHSGNPQDFIRRDSHMTQESRRSIFLDLLSHLMQGIA
jgi:hypothetical protein